AAALALGFAGGSPSKAAATPAGLPWARAGAGGAVFVDVADDDAERYLLEMINRERLEGDRRELARNPALDELARLKAWDMARRGYFDHVSSSYGTVFDMLKERGISHKWAGENIARVRDAATAHEAF